MLGFIGLTGVIFCFKETLTPYKPANSSTVALTSSSRPFAVFRSANLRSMVCMNSINMLCDTGFVETYPLWCWSSKDKGGLNFDPQEIGGTLTVSYIAMICVQTVLYSRWVKRLGLIEVIKMCSTATIPVLLGLPFIGLLRDTQWMLRFALVLGCLLYYLLGFNIVTSIFILTNNSVQQQDRAKVNAFLMSMGYIVKGFTPLLIGYLFAYTSEKGRVFPFDYHFVFVLLAVGMEVEAFLAKSLEMPKSAEYSPVLRTSEGNRTEQRLQAQFLVNLLDIKVCLVKSATFPVFRFNRNFC